MTRREFCNFLFLTSSALFAGSAGFAGKLAYDASNRPALAPMKIAGGETLAPGNALNFWYPHENDIAILIRTSSAMTGTKIMTCERNLDAAIISTSATIRR